MSLLDFFTLVWLLVCSIMFGASFNGKPYLILIWGFNLLLSSFSAYFVIEKIRKLGNKEVNQE